MLLPSIFGEDLFDDFMRFPTFGNFDDVERRLYGKNAPHIMKTDVHEHEGHYEVDIDLPGFKKDEIALDLHKGSLTVSAAKSLDKDEKTKKGKVIRQERYSGKMVRSFYVGEYVTENDIKASFTDGVLKLEIAKKDAPKIPEKKTIMIEG